MRLPKLLKLLICPAVAERTRCSGHDRIRNRAQGVDVVNDADRILKALLDASEASTFGSANLADIIKQLGLKTRDAQSALDQLGRNGLIEEGDEEGSVALTESGRDRAARVR